MLFDTLGVNVTERKPMWDQNIPTVVASVVQGCSSKALTNRFSYPVDRSHDGVDLARIGVQFGS